LAFSREVSAFVASGKNSEAVLFTPGPHARQHCQTYGLATDPIPLRLIRVKLKNGEIEGLATSLLEFMNRRRTFGEQDANWTCIGTEYLRTL